MKQAMIFAAGLGTRLKPLTDQKPKALVEVGGESLLKHVILRLKAAGFNRILINVHHFPEQIINYLNEYDHFGLEIAISDESAALLDTGGGLKKALPFFDPDKQILIHNVDILSNVNLKSFYAEAPRMHNYGSGGYIEASATLLVSWRETKRYLLFDEQMRLVGWTNIETGEVRSPFKWLREFGEEHPEEFHTLSVRHGYVEVKHRLLGYGRAVLKAYAFSGIHCFSPSLFSRMADYPARFPIMDFYLDNCASAPIKGYVADGMKLMDVGKLNTLQEAEKFITELNK